MAVTSPTATSQVRLLIPDVSAPQQFTDEQITDLLTLNSDSVRLAAADALETIASQLTSVQSDDISLDGSKRAATLMARARALRDQAVAATADDGFFFAAVTPAATSTGLRRGFNW